MRRYVFPLKLLLTLLLLAFIWGHSFMPGEMSSMESEWVLTLVRPVVEALRRGLSHMGYDFDQSFLVRKLAHFLEYALLGVLSYILFLRPDGRGRCFLPMALCLAAAGIDEGIQRFSLNRGPALRDVMLDFCGACTGILLVAVFLAVLYGLVLRRRRRR